MLPHDSPRGGIPCAEDLPYQGHSSRLLQRLQGGKWTEQRRKALCVISIVRHDAVDGEESIEEFYRSAVVLDVHQHIRCIDGWYVHAAGDRVVRHRIPGMTAGPRGINVLWTGG